MDYILQFLYTLLPFLHILALIVILIKVVNIFINKRFDFAGFIISFFRIYSKRDWDVSSNKRRGQYMTINNYTNYYLYTWLFISLMIFLIYGNFGFGR